MVDAKHPSFQNCTIDTSDSVRDGLKLITEKIIEEAIMTTDPDIIGISLVLDAKDEENSEGMCNIDHDYGMGHFKANSVPGSSQYVST